MVYLWKEISLAKNAQRNNKKCKIKVNMGNLKAKGAVTISFRAQLENWLNLRGRNNNNWGN